ncbi:MAG: transposase [Chlorobi bacterium]|nr:transposase [Chlorobiota bacterium]
MKNRRKYDKSFKLEVVRRSLEEVSVKELAEELGIHAGMISRWRKGFFETGRNPDGYCFVCVGVVCWEKKGYD